MLYFRFVQIHFISHYFSNDVPIWGWPSGSNPPSDLSYKVQGENLEGGVVTSRGRTRATPFDQFTFLTRGCIGLCLGWEISYFFEPFLFLVIPSTFSSERGIRKCRHPCRLYANRKLWSFPNADFFLLPRVT